MTVQLICLFIYVTVKHVQMVAFVIDARSHVFFFKYFLKNYILYFKLIFFVFSNYFNILAQKLILKNKKII